MPSGGLIYLSFKAADGLAQAAQQLFPELEAGKSMPCALLPTGACLYLGERAELRASLSTDKHPFYLDLLAPKLRWRIEHPGAEALLRACGNKLSPGGHIYDATAGMGRDALLLSSRGFAVTMFERQPIIYLLLFDALNRAKMAGVYNFILPTLHYGTALAATASSLPEVIYYDPMFPPRRKEALVKKEMQVFHQLVGFDTDIEATAGSLLRLCTKRLVIKRPAGAVAVSAPGLKPAYQVDGGGCRFDCYLPPKV